MSFAELKEQVAGLSSTERFQPAAFLADLEYQSEAEFRAESIKAMQAMDAGHKIMGAEFERLHNELMAKGR